jgi:hypothetical protein
LLCLAGRHAKLEFVGVLLLFPNLEALRFLYIFQVYAPERGFNELACSYYFFWVFGFETNGKGVHTAEGTTVSTTEAGARSSRPKATSRT